MAEAYSRNPLDDLVRSNITQDTTVSNLIRMLKIMKNDRLMNAEIKILHELALNNQTVTSSLFGLYRVLYLFTRVFPYICSIYIYIGIFTSILLKNHSTKKKILISFLKKPQKKKPKFPNNNPKTLLWASRVQCVRIFIFGVRRYIFVVK